MMKRITELSDGKITIGPGTLYRSIKHLLADGLIAESEQRPDPKLDDQRRRYYRLTPWGAGVLDAEIQRLGRLVDVARQRQLGLRSET